MKSRSAQIAAYKEWLEFEKCIKTVPPSLKGRLKFREVIPTWSEVFFSGSAGLLKAVKRAAAVKRWNLHYGPTFDQDTNSSSTMHKWIPFECCRRAARANAPDQPVLESVVSA